MTSTITKSLCCFHRIADLDECASAETNECDSNALCNNTQGSYVCRCMKGFEGDGRNCTGKRRFEILNSLFASKSYV